ncbi:MAG: GAP family protein [Eubacteriales bacterium]|jgi:cytochrome c biogenesis protein CcdA|nr:GAP family protein [Eubacteriales bacterium]
MWVLLLLTILTSAADSLNPFAITQQFVLQSMVKKPRHIWYFIIPTGVTNLIGGFMAYFGLVAFIGNFFDKLVGKHGQILFTTELILGVAFLIGTGFLLQSNKIELLKKQIQSLKPSEHNGNKNDEAEAARKIKSVSPMALVALGVGATISELTTALPYFAFLAILFNYQLTLLQVTFILIVYNTIYTLPLMILYFIYIKAQDKFDRLYKAIKAQVTKWADILAPSLVSIIGIILVYHSISFLLK